MTDYKLHCITHVWNEEDLLPYWVDHHLPLFDKITFIDHNSTDRTREIIKSLAPDSLVIQSELQNFNAWANDAEVMKWENAFYNPPQITFVLNTTEFIWAEDFRSKIISHFERVGPNRALGIGSIIMVDNTNIPTFPIWVNKHKGFIDTPYPGVRRKRYIHNAESGAYGLGRHMTHVPAEDIHDIFLLYMAFCPWPLVKKRKLAIQSRIPPEDKAIGAGKEHILTEESLEARYQEYLAKSVNLLECPEFAVPYAWNLKTLWSVGGNWSNAFSLHFP